MPLWVSAQMVPRVAGLEGNAQYMSLLKQEKQLHGVEDSILNVIAGTRKLFTEEVANKDKYAKEIVGLEEKLYDVRNRIGIVVGSINTIEQEFVINNIGKQGVAITPTTASAAASTMSVNEYIRQNLSQADQTALAQAVRNENVPPRLIARYLENYDAMKKCIALYENAPEEEALQAFASFDSLALANRAIEDSITKIWGGIYDIKIYTYTLLLDKMNKTALLADMEKQFNQTNQAIATVRGKVDSEVIFGYPLRNKLVLAYETALSGALADKKMYDSVTRKAAFMEKLDYDLPLLKMERRNFIPYEDIKVSSVSVYNASKPIPKEKVYDNGTVYKVSVGVFSRQQPVSIFRGVSPVSYDVLEDGRYRYCVGAYRTLSEVQKAAADLKKIGFRSPQIVVWKDGVFESLGDPQEAAASVFYRVEIGGMGDVMDAAVKAAIEQSAPGKEISRIVAPDGKFVYLVGSFDSEQDAKAAAAAVIKAKEGAQVKVSMIEV